MGCDIHCYVEYRAKDPDDVTGYEQPWQGFGGHVNPGRDYATFARLAGVRGPLPAGGVPPRGFPPDADYAAMWGHWLLVSTRPDPEPPRTELEALLRAALAHPGETTPLAMLRDEIDNHLDAAAAGREWVGRLPGSDRIVTAERAAGFVARGQPHLPRDGKVWAVLDPDNHDHSWLTRAEWVWATAGAGVEYQLITAALREIEARGYEARVVFSFDN